MLPEAPAVYSKTSKKDYFRFLYILKANNGMNVATNENAKLINKSWTGYPPGVSFCIKIAKETKP